MLAPLENAKFIKVFIDSSVQLLLVSIFIGRWGNQVAYQVSHLKYLNAWLIWYLSLFPPIKNWHLNTWVYCLKPYILIKYFSAINSAPKCFMFSAIQPQLRVCVLLSSEWFVSLWLRARDLRMTPPKLSLLCLLTVPDEILAQRGFRAIFLYFS